MLRSLFILLVTTCTIGLAVAKENPLSNKVDEDFGKMVSNSPEEGGGEGQTVTMVLPVTESENQKRQELLKLHGDGKLNVQIYSIDPEGGPTSGDTRVLVRGGPFKDMFLLHPNPKCKFGRHDHIVSATYVTCTQSPLNMQEVEGKHKNRLSHCLQCEGSPAFDTAIQIPLSVSLTGDFLDSDDSEPFRYYPPTIVSAIYPRYGPKDGNTFVEVWGENFFNFDDYLKCNFGTVAVTAHFVNKNYMTCRSPQSDVVQKATPFTVSLNKQQNSRQKIDYWFYNQPQVVQLVPNYGPDTGGNVIELKGSNFHPFKNEDIDNSNDTFCFFEQIGKMPLKVKDSTKAFCEAPPNTPHLDFTYVEIMLNNREGDITDDDVPYFYYKPPKIYDVQPREGPTRGGTTVVLSGLDFKAGKKIICQFGDAGKTIGKMISPTQIKCLSPKTPNAGPVPLTITYDGDGANSQSEPVSYLYYDTPEIHAIEPVCGPTYGYTQITVRGNNFIDMGFGKAKCIFNGTMGNATIVDKTTIKCSTPKLTEDQESLDAKYMFFNVQVTLNALEASENKVKFNYYPQLQITSVTDSELGPISGDTVSQLGGKGFNHPNVCNPKVRYGAIEVTPKIFSDSSMSTTSPQVSLPDSVVLSPSGNGQNYATDYTLHFRDRENTFTYYQDIFLLDMNPASGPVHGHSKVHVTGFGFRQFQYDNGTHNEQSLFMKFVDQNGNQIGNYSEVTGLTNDDFVWYVPTAQAGTQANIQLSFNKKNWQDVKIPSRDVAYLYYNAPQLNSIEPHFGPVKNPFGSHSIITGKNFQCIGSCDDLVVRFGGENNGTLVSGELLSDTQIRVLIPRYPKPDVLPVAVSFNKQDFTSDFLVYGFFDPFLLQVNPRLISIKGSTRLTLTGFGFVFSTAEAIKTKFATKDAGDLKCREVGPCIERADYVNKNTILADSIPLAAMSYKDTGRSIDYKQGMTVEVAVYEDIFTTNQLQVWYYKDPVFQGINKKSVPNNINHELFVNTDFFWDVNDFYKFNKYGNFTCKFQVGDEIVYTRAHMETNVVGGMYAAEEGNVYPTQVVCASPKMHNSGKGRMWISVNGQDYLEAFEYESSVPMDLYRLVPQCGPKEGQTKVKLMGSGFISPNKDDIFGKFGTIGVYKFEKDQILSEAWHQSEWLSQQLMTESDLLKFEHLDHKLLEKESLNTIFVQTPLAPVDSKTIGGPVYVSVGQHVQFHSQNETDSQSNSSITVYQYTYSNSLVEFYYYKVPSVKKVEPTSGLTTGGTPIEISGIWFDQKTEYGMFPYCKIGNMIVRASFSSTVRIVCYSPPSDYILAPLPVKVSLNGIDWHDTGSTFSYYYQPEVYKNFPTAGQMAGGTEVYISGEHFSNITDSDNVKCKFSLYDSIISGRKVESRTTPALYINETMMWCASPSGFQGGDKCHVQLTFNGMDYSQESDSLSFNYFNIVGAFPHSGPANAGDETILIRGAGFNPKSKVYCNLNRTDSLAVEITPNLIKCPMMYPGKDPQSTGGVKFGISMDGSWTDFGIFYYYQQIELSDVQPNYGPNIGTGLVYIYGSNFRNDFINVEIGCKIGESIGQGELVDSSTIRCVVEEIELANFGESLPVYAALNSYSWVGGSKHRQLADHGQLSYIPYGIISMTPESGPFSGFTDILITGKGFQEENGQKAKCKFGTDSNYAQVDAQVIDYTKMVCRSPENFHVADLAGDSMSVPFSISFNDEDFKPWTKDTHRFHFYTQPVIELADPNEVKIGKMSEIYVFAQQGSRFIQPVPNQQEGGSGLSCSFEQFGVSMGMYVNETTVLCMSPHFQGTSDDYYRETVTVGVALNGQDFGEILSLAQVTFVGTGNNTAFLHFVFAALLIALLLLACATCCTALAQWWQQTKYSPRQSLQPQTLALRNSDGSVMRSYNQGYNISNSRASGGFRNSQQT